MKDGEGKLIGAVEVLRAFSDQKKRVPYFDIMEKIARADWDTLMFFYVVIRSIY